MSYGGEDDAVNILVFAGFLPRGEGAEGMTNKNDALERGSANASATQSLNHLMRDESVRSNGDFRAGRMGALAVADSIIVEDGVAVRGQRLRIGIDRWLKRPVPIGMVIGRAVEGEVNRRSRSIGWQAEFSHDGRALRPAFGQSNTQCCGSTLRWGIDGWALSCGKIGQGCKNGKSSHHQQDPLTAPLYRWTIV